MFSTLLATLLIGIFPTHLPQWEVDTPRDELVVSQRVEVSKEKGVLCSIVDDRFVFPPSYLIKERKDYFERECVEPNETNRYVFKETTLATGGVNDLSISKEDSTDIEPPRPDGQNEQVSKPTVEQPKTEVNASTPPPVKPAETVAPVEKKVETVKPVEKKVEAPQPKPQPKQEVKKEEPKQEPKGTVIGKFNTSHYTAGCTGCSGITASGYNVRNTIYKDGLRIVATDPKIIPLGTIIKVTYNDGTSFKAVALDTGGAIKGHKLDVLVASKKEAYALGRVTTTVEVVK